MNIPPKDLEELLNHLDKVFEIISKTDGDVQEFFSYSDEYEICISKRKDAGHIVSEKDESKIH